MKEKTIGVCAFSYRKMYYIKRPWKFFREIKIAVRNYWHRARCGYAWVDLWNMDNYLGQLIPNMLRELSKRACGYPGTEEYPTPEVYQEYLELLATLFENLNIDEFDPEYEEVGRKLLEMKEPDNFISKQLLDGAKDAVRENPKYWSTPLMKYVYQKLGEAAAKGLLWD